MLTRSSINLLGINRINGLANFDLMSDTHYYTLSVMQLLKTRSLLRI